MRVSPGKKGYTPEYCVASRQTVHCGKPVEIDLTTQIQPLPHPYLDSMRVSLGDNPTQSPIKIDLFDNRFSLVFSRRFLTHVEWTRMMEKQPLSQVVLRLGGKWQLPQVVLRTTRKQKEAAGKRKRKSKATLARLHVEVKDRPEEERLAGVESLPLPATPGFILDARNELGDWILWEMPQNPADSGEDEGVKWKFVRVLDVI